MALFGGKALLVKGLPWFNCLLVLDVRKKSQFGDSQDVKKVRWCVYVSVCLWEDGRERFGVTFLSIFVTLRLLFTWPPRDIDSS